MGRRKKNLWNDLDKQKAKDVILRLLDETDDEKIKMRAAELILTYDIEKLKRSAVNRGDDVLKSESIKVIYGDGGNNGQT